MVYKQLCRSSIPHIRQGVSLLSGEQKVCSPHLLLQGTFAKPCPGSIVSLLIIINTYFPYYESIPNGKARPDPALVNAIFAGTHIWENDSIHPLPVSEIPPRFPALETTYLAKANERSGHLCGYFIGGGRAYCSCRHFQQTGKKCAGLWALATLNVAGRVAEYERNNSAARNDKPSGGNREVCATKDQAEMIDRWSDDILDDPQGCLIKSGLEPAVDSLVCESTRGVSPVSPICRRFRSGRREDNGEDHDPDSAEGQDGGPSKRINTNGRPAQICPLQMRRKPKKSTLRPAQDNLNISDRPTGFQEHWDRLLCFKPLPNTVTATRMAECMPFCRMNLWMESSNA